MAGRITCDSDGKLNEQSAMLEGTMQHSGGASVKLDLSKVRRPPHRWQPSNEMLSAAVSLA